MHAPKDAICPTRYHGRWDGVWEITWVMPGGKHKVTLQYGGANMPYGPTLLQQMWSRLDGYMAEIMEDSTSNRHETQLKAREAAEILALFMPPFFHNADDIAREAQRRYKARKAGDTEYETPGIGTRRYEPPPGTRHVSIEARQSRKPAKKVAPQRKQLKPEEVEGIKEAVSSGMFTKEACADMFKVPLATVEAALVN